MMVDWDWDWWCLSRLVLFYAPVILLPPSCPAARGHAPFR